MNLPDNPLGRRLAAQEALKDAVNGVITALGTDEAAKEGLRVLRFLGYAPKSTVGRKSNAEKAAQAATVEPKK